MGVLLVLALLATPARSACPPHSLALYTLQLNTSWTEEDFPRQALQSEHSAAGASFV